MYMADFRDSVYGVTPDIISTVTTRLGDFSKVVVSVTDGQFGAKGDGIADDTSAIQAAIDYAYNLGGGTVQFPAGTFISRQLKLKSKVTLRGSGWSTTVKLQNGQNTDLIVLNDVNTYFTGISRLKLDGNSANNTVGSCIYYDNTGGTWPYADPTHTWDNLIAENGAQYGFHLGGDVRQLTAINCLAKLAQTNGWIFDNGATDNFFIACVSATSGMAGWNVGDGNNNFVNCKSFSSGWKMVVIGDPGDGFYVTSSRNKFYSCEVQDNNRNGFTLTSTATFNILNGVLADSNGKTTFGNASGFNFDGCQKNYLTGCVAGNQRATQEFGINFQNSPSNNIIQMMIKDQNSGFIGGAVSSQYNNSLQINGNINGIVVSNLTASYTPDPSTAVQFILTIGANISINNTVFASKWLGAKMKFILIQDATGGRAVTFGSDYKLTWTPVTTAGKTNIVEFICDGTNWIPTSVTTGM